MTKLFWDTGLLPCCPPGPMPGAGGEGKTPDAAECWARCRPSLSRASLGPGREQQAGQPAGPGGLGAQLWVWGKCRVLLPSRLPQVAPAGRGERQKCESCSGWVSSPHLSANHRHPAVKTMMGALIVHFLDLELHLHLLSRIKSSP